MGNDEVSTVRAIRLSQPSPRSGQEVKSQGDRGLDRSDARGADLNLHIGTPRMTTSCTVRTPHLHTTNVKGTGELFDHAGFIQCCELALVVVLS